MAAATTLSLPALSGLLQLGSLVDASSNPVFNGFASTLASAVSSITAPTPQAQQLVKVLQQPDVLPGILKVLATRLPDLLLAYCRLYVALADLQSSDFMGWLETRVQTLGTVWKTADQVDELAEADVSAAKVSSGLQIGAAALGLFGLLAAPFTFGGSLALTALSTGVGLTQATVSTVDSIRNRKKYEGVMQELQNKMNADMDKFRPLSNILNQLVGAMAAVDAATQNLTADVFTWLGSLSPDAWKAAEKATGKAITVNDVINGWGVMKFGVMGNFAGTLATASGTSLQEWKDFLQAGTVAYKAVASLKSFKSLYVLHDAMELVSLRTMTIMATQAGKVGEMAAAEAALQGAMKGVAVEAAAPGFSIFGKKLITAGSKTAIGLNVLLNVYLLADGINDLVKANRAGDEKHQKARELRQMGRQLVEETQNVCAMMAAFARERGPADQQAVKNTLTAGSTLPAITDSALQRPNFQDSTAANTILAKLPANSYLASPGGYFKLVLWGDGVLTFLATGQGRVLQLWSSSAGSKPQQPYLTLQADGNLVVYEKEGAKALWATSTNGGLRPDSSVLVLEDGGDVSVQRLQPEPPRYMWHLPYMGPLPDRVVPKDLSLVNGKKCAFLAPNGQRIGLLNPGNRPVGVIAKAWATGEWETFKITALDASTIAVYSAAAGCYLTAEGAPRYEVYFRAASIGDWEKFTVESLGGGYIHLKTAWNRYVVCEKGGGDTVDANRQEALEWETLKFILVENL